MPYTYSLQDLLAYNDYISAEGLAIIGASVTLLAIASTAVFIIWNVIANSRD